MSDMQNKHEHSTVQLHNYLFCDIMKVQRFATDTWRPVRTF